MQRLLDFLYRQREIGIFLFLEIVSVWLLINYNQRYNASYFNSSNRITASVNQSSESTSDYFELSEINNRLMMENELLKQELMRLSTSPDAFIDTVERYRVIGAEVVSNTINRSTNFLTISAGFEDSIAVGMGVITGFGVVGQVKSVSKNFATVYSVLHPNLMISSKVKRDANKGYGPMGSIRLLACRLKVYPKAYQIEYWRFSDYIWF